MFGHNSFVWTPVKIFNAGTEAPADYTGPFLYVSKGVDGREGAYRLYNEDASPYYLPNYQVHSRFGSKQSAIDAIPDGIYYKDEVAQPPVAPTPKEDCENNLNRSWEETKNNLGTWTISCGECLPGYEEPEGDTGCKAGYHEGKDRVWGCTEPCVPISDDPNYCAVSNRVLNDDTTCGDCKSGYEEDENGKCVIIEGEGFDWGKALMLGSVAVIGFIAL